MNAVLQLEDFKDDFDPFTAWATIGGEGAIIDPYPELARLRQDSPVQAIDLRAHFGVTIDQSMEGLNPYVILGHKEVSEVLSNHADYSSKIFERNLGEVFGATITAMDTPEHGRYRRLFQAAFTPVRLDAMRLKFQGVIDRLLSNFMHRGKADLVQEFAFHFPFQFITDLMELPMADRPLFHKIAFAQTTIGFAPYHGREASRILGNYLTQLCEVRRELKSSDDFVSLICNAEVENERLPDDVTISFFRQLMNAGGDTSYHGFSNALTALFSNPDQLEAVKNDRSLIPLAIDEALRWNCPVMIVHRTPKRDVVLGGVEIEAGANLIVCLGAANRDENVFPEPDKFDIFRERKRHVAFGFGLHVCIGQHLARMELTMALNALLDRLPNLRLDPDSPPPVVTGLGMRGAHSVNVVWDL
ncbi:cytochrome P450 [Pseudomonas sp. BF-R-19]|uniref:cytochrome P450 n=1 Tax=Pseudomonas sp. BF-R-19 TaxID=2832397 RepID=UPI001CBDF465|nr:cytochrome P450 [Pseudomonas sp. BF-R-19]